MERTCLLLVIIGRAIPHTNQLSKLDLTLTNLTLQQ
jgi:hypothetical protein